MRVIAIICSVVVVICIATSNLYAGEGSAANQEAVDYDCLRIPGENEQNQCQQLKNVANYFYKLNLKSYFPEDYNPIVLKAVECFNASNEGKETCIKARKTLRYEYSFIGDSLHTWDTGFFSESFRAAAKECGFPSYVQLHVKTHELWFIVCNESDGPELAFIYEHLTEKVDKNVYRRKKIQENVFK
ncbi:MAG: hypothetical protein OEV92_01775 [Nitrospinota bacterium]|nr:hypothetical protein [Nitrospinota bacterium]